MQRLEVSGAVRLIHRSLCVKGLSMSDVETSTRYKCMVLKISSLIPKQVLKRSVSNMESAPFYKTGGDILNMVHNKFS